MKGANHDRLAGLAPVYSMIVLSFLITGCGTYYPRLTGIPLIKGKGDTRIEGGVTILDPDIQASVSAWRIRKNSHSDGYIC